MNFLKFFRNRLILVISKSDGSQEENLRFQLYTLFLTLGIPIMLIFGYTNYAQQQYLIMGIALASALTLSLGWVVVKFTNKSIISYRLNAILFLSLLLYMLCYGGEGGSKILWMYTFPLVAFFLFGTNEGLVWSVSTIVLIVILFYYPQLNEKIHSYNSEFKLRFLVSFLCINIISYGLEFLRDHYRLLLEERNMELEKEIAARKAIELEREKAIENLQNALDEVQTLSDLLPICSACKKIRDDSGYWQKLEIYFTENTNTEFSHSLCPECAKELYKNEKWYQKMSHE